MKFISSSAIFSSSGGFFSWVVKLDVCSRSAIVSLLGLRHQRRQAAPRAVVGTAIDRAKERVGGIVSGGGDRRYCESMECSINITCINTIWRKEATEQEGSRQAYIHTHLSPSPNRETKQAVSSFILSSSSTSFFHQASLHPA